MQPVARERGSASPFAGRARGVRVADEAAQRVLQDVHARGDPAGLTRDRLRRLGRGERDDRHAEVHRLQQREAKRGPADRVQVHAPACQLVVHALLGQSPRPPSASASMPKRSSGATASKRLRRSVPVTRPRRRASLIDDGAVRDLARVAVAGIRDAVLDHARRRRAGIPEEVVEVRDVHEREVAAVGGRVAHVGDPPLRRVVLEVDGREVAARLAAAEQFLGERVQLARALEDHDVDVRLGRLLRRHLDRVRRPLPGLCAPAAVGAAVWEDGDEDSVTAVDEGGRPAAVHVPEKDVHAATALCVLAGGS